MVNLRYHIVSLVAVFLALGVGIVMGSTVIDRAIVDNLSQRVKSVESSVRRTRAENRGLNTQVQVLRDFAEQARQQLLVGQLRGVPVLVVGVQGVDRKPVEALRDALLDADAVPAGTVWFTAKMRLDGEGDIRALASTLSVAPAASDTVRRVALGRLASIFQGSSGDPTLLAALSSAGFVAYEPPVSERVTSPLGLNSFPVAGLRVVMVSGAGAEVGDDLLAAPFAEALVQASGGTSRVLAAESGQDRPGGRAVFVGGLRSNGQLAARLSTVDNLESAMGLAAAVLALEDLGAPRVGHFGVGPGAEALLPRVPT